MWDAIIIQPFTNVLLFIYNVSGQNFGIAIILFTMLIRLVTHPLTVQQMKGTSGMQEFQKDPRWIEAQEKFKGDKEKLAQEQMRLYKELGINPAASCLPLVIQFPIIIGLYQAIIQSMAKSPLDLLNLTRHVYPGFLDVSQLFPLNNQFLWMNLGQPERLNLPFLSFGIPVLAILVVVTTFLQSKLMTPPAANPKDQSAQMAGIMNLYMPVFMGWLAYTLASGLALYFVISNVFGILQYALLGKANWKNLLSFRKPSVTLPEKSVNKLAAKTPDKPADKPEKKPASSQEGKPNRGKNESRKNNARSNRANS
ncbi:MAG: membrane protein insertase YidC [Anaerolineaceae bacterium]|nr:membrane protein insertase YidC [Anaerolineaceae bacterium]